MHQMIGEWQCDNNSDEHYWNNNHQFPDQSMMQSLSKLYTEDQNANVNQPTSSCCYADIVRGRECVCF
jgi:hypothetical protein